MSFSVQAFGIPDFQWSDIRDGWQVFRNRPWQMFSAPDNMEKLYHATTLSQCRDILHDGFKVGLEHTGSISSPAGIWGCSHPGHSVNRAPLHRGYSFHAENCDKGIVCGWDCPVVFAWDIETQMLKTHAVLADGSCVWVHKQPCGTIWDARSRPTSIWISMSLYHHLLKLPSVWHELQEGTMVVCRSRDKKPSDLYRAGDAAPMTCGRVCAFEQLGAEQWKKARASRQWYCPTCAERCGQSKPCTGWIFV